ncbi:MAG TPA: NAD(+) diphosphatase [Marinagarivorans sp.]
MSDVWLVANNAHFLPAKGGIIHHRQQPLEAAVFLPVANHLGKTWHMAIVEEPPAEHWLPLRQLMGEVDSQHFALLSRAAQLEHWWRHHRFCGKCGANTRLHHAELALACGACRALYFPRISPCVIGLITRGKYCLLAKHARSKGQRYSCLAGFIEVGESAEQAFMREVHEEVGLRVANLRYVTSQNWPFPSQLMLGYFADYNGGEIAVDGVEIEHADWFGADNLQELPPKGTISRNLIDHFFASLE